MLSDHQPVVVAYDGSAEAREAVRVAATLFAGRPLVIVSVWEPGLAQAMAPLRDPTGLGYGIATPEETEVIDEAQHEHAVEAADDGARLARELGAVAEALSATEGGNLAETILAIADDREACAIVVGSRGLGGFKSRLLGSTSRDMLHRTRRPVLVVKAPE